jgi:hypothetical protein
MSISERRPLSWGHFREFAENCRNVLSWQEVIIIDGLREPILRDLDNEHKRHLTYLPFGLAWSGL